MVERYRIDLNRAQRRSERARRDHVRLTEGLRRLEVALDQLSERHRQLRAQAAAMGIPGPLRCERDEVEMLVESLDELAEELAVELDCSADDVLWISEMREYLAKVSIDLANFAATTTSRTCRASRRRAARGLHQSRPPVVPRSPHAPPALHRGSEGAPHTGAVVMAQPSPSELIVIPEARAV